MQVSLFDDSTFVSEARRLSKQMETRKFELYRDIDSLKQVYKLDKSDALGKIKEALNAEKRYKRVGNSACDNYFYLEALGIGTNCKKYTIILDFSERLDYILHRLSGCETANIRKMADYTRVSCNLLNLNFENLEDINFAAFLHLDPKLDTYLMGLVDEAAKDEFDDEIIVTNFINSFYNQILSELACVKDYCIVALRASQPPQSFVYRSKSFSSALASSDNEISDVLRITCPGKEDCVINVKSYETCQYVWEGKEAM